MKTLFSSLAAMALSAAASNAAVFSLSGPMDVLQAGTNGGFGAGTGNGAGMIGGSYDDATNILNYTLTWQDLSSGITNMHFHNAPAGSSGGVDQGIPAPWTSPYVGSVTLDTQAKEDNLLAGDWYVNIHTADFGGGEIRGQVIVTPVPEPSTSIFLLGGVAAIVLRRRRK